ncbi:uncharacterized protein LOC132551628 [Ylistrum balloti]|uniref:uncharacterized protein LOC132551628 n=1 Tax=Ylistrum balloti TaxID=509963 RepID=UPI002905CF61|nr:uncharacterized protein LOC132551628 [Ylistrum balloti]
MNIYVCLCFVVFGCIQGLLAATPVDVNARTLQDIEDEVRGLLILKVLNNVNATLARQQAMILDCETKINQTIDTCETCVASNPGVNAPSADLFSRVVSELNKPVVAMGRFFNGASQDIANLGGIMGSKSEQFATLTTSTLKNIGTFLGGEAEKAVAEVKKALNTAGRKFSDLGAAISNAIDTSGGFVNGVTKFGASTISKLNSLPDLLSSGATSALSGLRNVVSSLPNVGTQIVGGLTDLGNSIGGFFSGRRRRSTDLLSRMRRHTAALCPECDKIDITTKTEAEIFQSVCGATFTTQQQQIVDELSRMTKLYKWSKTLTNSILSQISYDNDQLDYSRIADQILNVSPLNVTFTVGTVPQTYQTDINLNIFDPTQVAPQIADEIYANA